MLVLLVSTMPIPTGQLIKGWKVGTVRALGSTNIFAYSFQSSIRASRGTVGGYFLAGRSMTWWPVSWPSSLLSQHIFPALYIHDLLSAFLARTTSTPSYIFAQLWVPILPQSPSSLRHLPQVPPVHVTDGWLKVLLLYPDRNQRQERNIVLIALNSRSL